MYRTSTIYNIVDVSTLYKFMYKNNVIMNIRYFTSVYYLFYFWEYGLL